MLVITEGQTRWNSALQMLKIVCAYYNTCNLLSGKLYIINNKIGIDKVEFCSPDAKKCLCLLQYM